MAHYAFLDENYIVVEVIPGKDESNFDWERYYGDIRGMVCKRTSYHTSGNVHIHGGTPYRKNYAGIGYTYDTRLDAFIPPKPFPSWTLNEDTGLWNSPVPYPDDDKPYVWNEDTLSWQLNLPPDHEPPPPVKDVPTQPFPSWKFNESTQLWESPVPYPDEGVRYYWDEPTVSWKLYVPSSQ